jgi:gliding-associated putative ABC transporter substrate-binding component GldG
MSMDKKKRSVASNAAFFLVAVIGIVVAVNLISTRVFGRLDMTDTKVYTLSPASKDVVRDLKDYLTVKAYISDTLPPELKSLSRYLRDLLDEYRANSKGKLKFEAVDPVAAKLEEEASSCGVRKLQIQKMEDQKIEVGAYYLGLCLEYEGKNEAIPEIVNLEGVEYQITSIIKRMTQKKRKLALTTGHGELELSQGLQTLQKVLSDEFDTTSINPSTTPIPDDVDALLVGGPKQAYDDKGRHEIDTFLMKGKGAIFLVDGMAMSSPRGHADMGGQVPKVGQANDAGLNDLLKNYGFTVEQDFVLDARQNAPGPVDVGGGRRMLANAPMYVGVQLDANDKDFTPSAGISAMIFPYASSVQLVGPLKDGKPARGKLWKLAETSPASWKVSGFFMYSPATKLEEPKDPKDRGPFALGYAYEGVLRSAYAPPVNAGMSSADSNDSKKKVRLMVIGDSDFASDEYYQMSRYLPIYGNGAQLLLNSLGWALEDEALTPVRAKTVTSRPIQLDPDQKVAAIKAFNIIGIPLAFCLFGIFRWRVRGRRRHGQKL